jgi:hypothetical protein
MTDFLETSDEGLASGVSPDVDTNPGTPDDLIEVGQIAYGDRNFRVTVGRNEEVFNQLVENSRQPHMRRMVPKDERSRFSSQEAAEAWYGRGRFLVTYWDEEDKVAAIDWFGPSSLQKELDELREKAEKNQAVIPELQLPGAHIDFEAPEGADHTFAIRLYDGFAGKDFPKPAGENASFARRTMQEGESLYVQYLEAQGISAEGQVVWLETNLYKPEQDEVPESERTLNGSVYLYRNAGYADLGTYFNPDPENPEWRIAMTKVLAADMGALVLPGLVSVEADK